MIYVIYIFNENLVNEKRPGVFHLGGVGGVGGGVKGKEGGLLDSFKRTILAS